MKDHRLSSNYLYHFKKDFSILKLILEKGFRYSMWEEKLPYKNISQQNFVVCFCDIKFEDSTAHRDCYGNNAIVLTKKWGIDNSITPVSYIHKNSKAISSEYLKHKNAYRVARNEAKNNNEILQLYLINSLLYDKENILDDRLEDALNNNPVLLNSIESIENDYCDYYDKLKADGLHIKFAEYMTTLFKKVLELHHELEQRDSLLRIYEDNFKCPNSANSLNKVLYDEREWRAIKYLTEEDIKKDNSIYEEAVTNKYLPEKFNLKFTDDDVKWIIVESDAYKIELIDSIEKGNCLVSNKLKNHIYTVKEFVEK